ncbi:hypothetical protein D9758_017882 [Tetrapyrgos nigripes]|uniref:Uncharacterized protein n=1 Tax=Tetrapyrgos nigripes TaxID=182062 RepID=A0A8H5F1J9_9AGAR|nr:hypothetical protein D9758_017882 [Tetrapyrgos nigripes]
MEGIFLSHPMTKGRYQAVDSIVGHEHMLMNQAKSSILERQWTKEYRTVYKVAGALGEETLIVADLLALQRILHTGGYNYPRTPDERATIKRMFGKGIVCAEAANVFQRQRRNLNPAFSATQLKSFLALFQKHSQRPIQTWKDDLSSDDTTNVSTSKVYDLVAWIPRVTLDIIGENGGAGLDGQGWLEEWAGLAGGVGRVGWRSVQGWEESWAGLCGQGLVLVDDQGGMHASYQTDLKCDN